MKKVQKYQLDSLEPFTFLECVIGLITNAVLHIAIFFSVFNYSYGQEPLDGFYEDISFEHFYQRNRRRLNIRKNFREPKFIGSRSLIDSAGQWQIKLDIHDMGSMMSRNELRREGKFDLMYYIHPQICHHPEGYGFSANVYCENLLPECVDNCDKKKCMVSLMYFRFISEILQIQIDGKRYLNYIWGASNALAFLRLFTVVQKGSTLLLSSSSFWAKWVSPLVVSAAAERAIYLLFKADRSTLLKLQMIFSLLDDVTFEQAELAPKVLLDETEKQISFAEAKTVLSIFFGGQYFDREFDSVQRNFSDPYKDYEGTTLYEINDNFYENITVDLVKAIEQ